MRKEQIGIKRESLFPFNFSSLDSVVEPQRLCFDQLILLVVNALIIISLSSFSLARWTLLAYAGIDSLLLGLTIVGLFEGYFIALEYFFRRETIRKANRRD